MVAFYSMQEPAGSARLSSVGRSGGLPLREAFNGSEPVIGEPGSAIERVVDSGAPFGPYAASIKRGQLLIAPRHESPELSRDISGPTAQVSVVAWAKKEVNSPVRPSGMEFVAGAWAESIGARQFSVFMNLLHGDLSHKIDFEVSGEGGPTPGHAWCVTRAIGTRDVPVDVWNCLALTYDGRQIRAYNNGTLERRGNGTGGDSFYSNPFNYTGGIFDADAAPPPHNRQGANFTVGSNVCDEPAYFEGLIGGLAVYNRGLTAEEVAKICSRGGGESLANLSI